MHSDLLQQTIDKIKALDPEERAKFSQQVVQAVGKAKWQPNPGPQTEAYFSKADVLLFGGEPGGGKLLDLHTPIPTPSGWSTMGELRVGDRVLDDNGVPCTVVAKSEVDSTEQAYRMVFSDGSEIIAGARHQWVTSTRAERMRALKGTDEWKARRREARPKRGTGKKPWLAALNAANRRPLDLPTEGIRTTAEIAETVRRGDGGLNHAVKVAGATQLPAAHLLIDPYVLGVWLGDGTSKAGQITGLDEEIFEAVAAVGYEVTRHSVPKTRGVLGLQTQLKQLGVYGNKHIPSAYLRGSHEQRLALLQGLMDTDGYCDQRGQCEISLTRKVLIDDTLDLVHSLGIKAQLREGIATLDGRVIGPKWRIKFLTEHPAFRLPRKLIRQKRAGFRGTHDVRYIVACDPVAPTPMQCIQVDSPSHCYLAGRSMIPTHNSELILGLAFNEHENALLMRRQYTDLDALTDAAIRINGSRDGYNGSAPPSLKHERGTIRFGAAGQAGSEQQFMGRPRDLLGIDEATQFLKSQIRFLMGWVRSTTPGQRCRTVFATNPPLSADGVWVVEMFAPWLDPTFANPAKPGELRWVVVDSEDKDIWVDGPGQYDIGNGEMRDAESRTYIPSKLSDNPALAATDYQKRIDALPAEIRRILVGGFMSSLRDDPLQVIPTSWIQAAFKRWTPDPPQGVPMVAISIDPGGGGIDKVALARRYDWWYAPMIAVPGTQAPHGSEQAGLVTANRRHHAKIVIDMGGGYGSGVWSCLKENVEPDDLVAYKGMDGSNARTRDGKLGFHNKRAESYWKFREALDPDQPNGSPLALQEDPEVLGDLTAVTFEVTPSGIKLLPKDSSHGDSVKKRIGRSPDKGDAIVMAWSVGDKLVPKGRPYSREQGGRRSAPVVNLGPRRKRK